MPSKNKKEMNDEKQEQQLSVVSTSGIAATSTTTASVIGGSSVRNVTAVDEILPLADGQPSSSTASDKVQGSLDFIATGKAVKSLFSIPFRESDPSTVDGAPSKQKPVCLAIHNFDGTLIIDHAEDEENYFHRTNDATVSPIITPNPKILLPHSTESLALALSHKDRHVDSEALSLLVEAMNGSKETKGSQNHDMDHSNLLAPPLAPREYVEWKFQDMNLLVGTDALVVRSNNSQADPPTTTSNSAGVAVRVEEIDDLRAAWHSFQRKQQLLLQSQPSYAQALSQNPKKVIGTEASKDKIAPTSEDFPFEVPLQTCIMPSSGPFGGQFLIESSSKMRSSTDVTPQIQEDGPSADPCVPASTNPALSIVLDAYLDNLMANVPQLALCLQEKGLVQSIKFLQTEEIPSMMIHPSTLGMTTPKRDPIQKNKRTGKSSNPLDDMFSPQIMEMNASALLRFLKANCTRNNTTYLLRNRPPTADESRSQQQNIQLYDISSLSMQGQKKWIWWLATMSHRFALRLRHLEIASTTTNSLSESQKRTIRDRERSLFQQTLDLLQDLMDIDGNAHESLVASVREHMADTFLGSEFPREHIEQMMQPHNPNDLRDSSSVLSSSIPSSSNVGESQPRSFQPSDSSDAAAGFENAYVNVSVDALNKAQDHLIHGIKSLAPLFEKIKDYKYGEEDETPQAHRRRRRPGKTGGVKNADKIKGGEQKASLPLSPATVMQMFGMNHKLVHVSLRLADHHLKNYYSSSAMQALRTSGRRLAEAVDLMNYYRKELSETENSSESSRLDIQEKERSLLLQYVLLLQYCGYFGRSFAFDEKWRDQGHASGEDVISVLRDVEAALLTVLGKSDSDIFSFDRLSEFDELRKRSFGSASLSELSGVIASKESFQIQNDRGLKGAQDVLEQEKVLQREKRRVLVASSVFYSRAVSAFRVFMEVLKIETKNSYKDGRPRMLYILQKWLGDACNETGRTLLESLKSFLGANPGKNDVDFQTTCEQLLCSAKFWFSIAVESFENCKDITNLTLVRCNIGSAYKIEANKTFSEGDSGQKHAEICLQKAADELMKAHNNLESRDADPRRWDLVSEDLANVLIVLGTRRRRTLLGGSDSQIIVSSKRLTPGEEKSILDPLERALKIYEQSGNASQEAANHYQLAQTFFRLFLAQDDKVKAQQKLSPAVTHYRSAFMYYFTHLRGNETSFCLICLDLASIYAIAPGEEGLKVAVGCCLDTRESFSLDSVKAALKIPGRKEWLDNMNDVAQSVEKRLFELLRSLVKLNSSRYKALYKEGLSAKFSAKIPMDELEGVPEVVPILTLHSVLMAIKAEFDELKK
ncbi:hypothetical protein IV203_011731 [Nitzschia inconspicua]|uniref:EDRF1 TPR repeats region domain-containing protein n=1 Tax=Nitzschia inconspicua TaxID=303405 RepID=A0A9K3KTP5_9STRA|nr:hypothetical protein IV203_011731 [Nitzschia inconspicua]